MKIRVFVFAALALSLALAGCGKHLKQQVAAAAKPHVIAKVEPVPLGPLSRVATPAHYSLTLTIDPAKDSFSGHTEIGVVFAKARDTLYIHGLDLHVAHASLRLAHGKTIAVAYKQVDPSGVALLTFASTVPAGPATLVFDYDAPFNKSLEGLYKVIDHGTAYAFTQFESIDARRAFPSFDEPGFKTPFDVTVNAPADDKVIGNTRVVSDTGAGGGMIRTVFETTKPLPTYLIAVAVGPLDIVDAGDIPANQYRDHPIHLRGITAKGMGPRLAYALSLTPAIVNALESYYGVAYPFQKLDILAVPDFAAGAMENAGAVTFREQLLLMDANAPLDQKRSTLTVQAHELAHQWFGDYVTPTWWDNIWLNESFATWMEYKISQTVKPDQEFSRSTLSSALNVMRLDELPSARQIHQPVNGPDDIDNAFDDITYSKGGAVLSMFESYVGVDEFQKGIHAYLTKYAFKNATAHDFIQTIADTTNHPEIVAAFDSFIDQPNIPLINVEAQCAAGAANLNVTQSVYTPVGTTLPARQWNVPVCVTADGGPKICQMITPQAAQIPLGAKCPKRVFPNAQGAGYYRFAMDETSWKARIATATKLDAAGQLTLYHNVSAALRAGQASATDFFDVIKALAPVAQWDLVGADDNSFDVRKALHDLRVTGILSGDDLAAEQTFVRKNFGPRMAKIGLTAKPGETPATALMRERLATFLVDEGRDPALIASLTKAAHAYLSSGGTNMGGLPPELMQEAMRAGVLSEGAPFGDAVLEAFQKSDDEYFMKSAIYALAGSDDAPTLGKLLALTLTPTVRVGDIRYVVRYLSVEATARPILWDWFKTNFDAVAGRVSKQGLGQAPSILSDACDQASKDDLQAFFGPKTAEIPGAPRTLAQTGEKIDRCIALKSAKGAEIEAALKAAK